MNQDQTLYSAGTRILELISSSNELLQHIYPQLLSLKEELELYPLINSGNSYETKPISILDELNSNEKEDFLTLKTKIANQSVTDFLDKLQVEHQMNINKMKQFSITVANKCQIQVKSQQFKTIGGIYQWFEEYWDRVEPFTKTMLIVNCDSK